MCAEERGREREKEREREIEEKGKEENVGSRRTNKKKKEK